MNAPSAARRHDAPDTAAAFRRLASLPAGPERSALREEIIRSWLPMAGRLAGRYRNRGEEPEDLRQVAALGLTKAVERFDPERGKAFESYAVPVILGELRKHFRDCTWDVHVPRRVQELRNRVRRSLHDLPATPTGRPPTVASLAAHSGLTEEEVRQGLEALDSYSSLSLDAEPSGGDGGNRLLDTLGATDPGYQRVVLRESVRPCLQRLPERDRHLLYLRFYGELTQTHIGERLDLSQMQVSRLLRRACERVRQEAG